MSETVSTGTETAAVVAPATTAAVTPAVQTIATVDQLPEFAKSMISDLRNEAAKYRTAKGEAVEAAKTEVSSAFDAKLAESNTAHEATKAELNKASLNLARLKAAVAAEVPTGKLIEFASLLQGSNDEELKAHATQVKGLLGIASTSAVDPSVGQSGNGAAEGDDFSQYVLSMLNK